MENSIENMHSDRTYDVKALLTSVTLFFATKSEQIFFQQSITSAPGTAFS